MRIPRLPRGQQPCHCLAVWRWNRRCDRVAQKSSPVTSKAFRSSGGETRKPLCHERFEYAASGLPESSYGRP
jgi:hypothetical protein